MVFIQCITICLYDRSFKSCRNPKEKESSKVIAWIHTELRGLDVIKVMVVGLVAMWVWNCWASWSCDPCAWWRGNGHVCSRRPWTQHLACHICFIPCPRHNIVLLHLHSKASFRSSNLLINRVKIHNTVLLHLHSNASFRSSNLLINRVKITQFVLKWRFRHMITLGAVWYLFLALFVFYFNINNVKIFGQLFSKICFNITFFLKQKDVPSLPVPK